METAFGQARAARLTLRQVLNLDALTCTAFGLLLVFGAAPLASLLGVPEALLFWAGVVLFPSAALMLLAARRPAPLLLWTVIAGNAAWVVASVGVVVALDLTALGVVFVLAQAAAVLALTLLELRTR